MKLNNIDNSTLLLPLYKNVNVQFQNIIALLDPGTVEESYLFKSKKVIMLDENSSNIRSYIYCKDDYLIATTYELSTLKEKLLKLIESYYISNFNTIT